MISSSIKKSSKQKIKSKDPGSSTSATLTAASAALEAAKDLAPCVPVPTLSTIYATATVIVKIAQDLHQNRNECANLARKVAELTRDVNKEVHGNEDLVKGNIETSLRELEKTTNEIQMFMESQASKSILHRIIHSQDISFQVVQLNGKLEFTLKSFMTTSSLRQEIRLEQVSKDVANQSQKLDQIDSRMILDRKWDGDFRVYRMADIQLLRLYHREWVPQDKKLYRVEIKGQYRMAEVQTGPKDKFTSTIEMLKLLRQPGHVNVLQLEGYSDSSLSTNFFVFKGDMVRLMDTLEKPSSLKRQLQLVQIVAEIFLARDFLASHGLYWYGDDENLMLNTQSKALVITDSVSSFPVGPSAMSWDNIRDILTYDPPGPSSFGGWELGRRLLEPRIQDMIRLHRALRREISIPFDEILSLWCNCCMHDLDICPRSLDGLILACRQPAKIHTPPHFNILTFRDDFGPFPEELGDLPISVVVEGTDLESDYTSVHRKYALPYLAKYGPKFAREYGIPLEKISIATPKNSWRPIHNGQNRTSVVRLSSWDWLMWVGESDNTIFLSINPQHILLLNWIHEQFSDKPGLVVGNGSDDIGARRSETFTDVAKVANSRPDRFPRLSLSSKGPTVGKGSEAFAEVENYRLKHFSRILSSLNKFLDEQGIVNENMPGGR